MKVISHRPKSKTHSPTFTVERITRETLSLILAFARDAIEAHENAAAYESTLSRVIAIDAFVNSESMARLAPLELPDYGPVEPPDEEEDE